MTRPSEEPIAVAVPTAGICLELVERFVRRFVVLRDDQVVAWTLWIAHTWVVDAADQTPYIYFRSAEKRSGKSRALEVTELLAARARTAAGASQAALFRLIGEADSPPTILFDEIDAVFGRRREDTEDLRGLINAGHRRGAEFLRCVTEGKSQVVREFAVFCPKALAGIGGRLPDTVTDRAITIDMKRKRREDKAERFRRRPAVADAAPIREALAEWSETAIDGLRDARPDLPGELNDRAQDGWEPLLAIADAAGGEWPTRARRAALALAGSDPADAEDESLGVRLLSDVRVVFDERAVDRMASAALASALCEIEEAPWGDLWGRSLDSRALARLLKPYEVHPKQLKVAGEKSRGYVRDDFADAWSRYLGEGVQGA